VGTEIQEIFLKVVQGDSSLLSELYSLFLSSQIEVAVEPIEGLDGKIKIRLVTVHEDEEERILTAFSHVAIQERGYESVLLFGEDLLQAAPKKVNAFIILGEEDKRVRLVTDLLRTVHSGGVVHTSPVSHSTSQPISQPKTERPTPKVVASKRKSLEEDLIVVCQKYHEILEGSVLPPIDTYIGRVVGLLTTEIDPARRLMLIEDIANVSRSQYGFLGAIEVLHEVRTKTSAEWNEFLGVIPFFHRV
jgi:hypothetical protein